MALFDISYYTYVYCYYIAKTYRFQDILALL